LLANKTKPAATAFTPTSHVALFITIFDIAADAEGAFAKNLFEASYHPHDNTYAL